MSEEIDDPLRVSEAKERRLGSITFHLHSIEHLQQLSSIVIQKDTMRSDLVTIASSKLPPHSAELQRAPI